MANLRRHFNFSTKSSGNQDREIPFIMSSANKLSFRQFDKANLMNDICNCLNLCCSYIQALNSVCDAGSSLARNLFHAVREVPALQNVSLQFLSVWEEVSKATAGASAAVKTETLMMLQEILNSLEMGISEADAEERIAESFQVIGTCLCSFIELQAQFSFSTWKSFSKLSKHFTSDTVRHSVQWKSLEKSPAKISVKTDLNATIKKHFSQFLKIGISKINEYVEVNQSQYPPQSNQSVQGTTNVPVYSPFTSQSVSESADDDSVWSPQTTRWTSFNSPNVSFNVDTSISEQDSPSISTNSDLDEVINLLSCVPVQQPGNKLNNQNQNYFQYHSNNNQMYHLSPLAPMSRQLSNQQSWPKDPIDFSVNYDSWLWRVDNMNCSGLQANTDILNTQSQRSNAPSHWGSKELQKWNTAMCETGSSSDDGSSIHGPDAEFSSSTMTGAFAKNFGNCFSNRKSTSGESMPGGLENISESKEECLWPVHSRISTWPLKQSAFRNSESECSDKSDYSEHLHPFIPS